MSEAFATQYLSDTLILFHRYKEMAEKSVAQVSDEELFSVIDEENNSIAVIMKHMAGNMRSRWTDFLTSDGEKPDRHRDTEFIVGEVNTKDAIMARWESGWQCVFSAIEPLTPDDLQTTIYIREEPHSVIEAINRQLTHYAYHVGQIVMLAKHFRGKDWQTLSIPRGQSDAFNANMQERFGK
jgi:hypothetical protein